MIELPCTNGGHGQRRRGTGSRHRHGGAARASAGFTLIELLVVIGPSSPSSLPWLLPGLSMAKEKARRISCQSGLHQLGLALQMYGNDKPRPPPAGLPRDDGFTHTIWISTNTFNAIREYRAHQHEAPAPSLAGAPSSIIRAPYGQRDWLTANNGGTRSRGSGEPSPRWVSPQRFTDDPQLTLACDLECVGGADWRAGMGDRSALSGRPPQGQRHSLLVGGEVDQTQDLRRRAATFSS